MRGNIHVTHVHNIRFLEIVYNFPIAKYTTSQHLVEGNLTRHILWEMVDIIEPCITLSIFLKMPHFNPFS